MATTPGSRQPHAPRHSRDNGNVLKFCHWRQIERVIVTLSDQEVRGTVH